MGISTLLRVCAIPVLLQVEERYNEMWIEIAKHLNTLYNPIGVRVTVAKELVSHGSDYDMQMVIVGLHFEVVHLPPLIAVIWLREVGVLDSIKYKYAKEHLLHRDDGYTHEEELDYRIF